MKNSDLKFIEEMKNNLSVLDFAKMVCLFQSGERDIILNPHRYLRGESFKPQGPEYAPLVFISSELHGTEVDGGGPLTGDFAKTFNEKYLVPLSLRRGDVGFVTYDKNHIVDDLQKFPCALFVGWGAKIAKCLPVCDFKLPHPSVLLKGKDSGERIRKISQINKKLDLIDDNEQKLINGSRVQKGLIHKPLNFRTSNADFRSERISNKGADFRSDSFTGELVTTIQKAKKQKQIVYGVVTDPYCKNGNFIDAHGDWITPAAIEEDAHQFIEGDRIIGLQHVAKADARMVESHIEQYPSYEDYFNAINGKAHSIYRRPFGDKFVHSGSWIAGVKLGDKEWGMYQRGEIKDFSPGGVGLFEDFEVSEMPDVEIKKLGVADA